MLFEPNHQNTLFVTILLMGLFISGVTYYRWYRRQGVDRSGNPQLQGTMSDPELRETTSEPELRGTPSERKLKRTLLRAGIGPDHLFHDLYIPKAHRQFAQVDMVLVTDAGIIVIEVKDLQGWIYGTGNQPQWTQVLSYGSHKYRFFNPILQNRGHIKAIRQELHAWLPIPFFSVIVFYGDCQLKNMQYIPTDTYIVKAHRILEAIDTIIDEHEAYAYTDEEAILRVLAGASANGNDPELRQQHIRQVNDLTGKERVFD